MTDPWTTAGKPGTPSRFQGGDTAEDRAPVERDQHGRYMLPDPRASDVMGNGSSQPDMTPIPWTRVSTLAHELAETSGITGWEKKHIARGIALRPDLAQRALAHPIESYREAQAAGRTTEEWKEVLRMALEFSGANERSNLGTAHHELTYRHNRGDTEIRNLVLPQYQRDFDLYVDLVENQMLPHQGLRIVPGLLERTVVNTRYNCAGTFDNGLLSLDGTFRIGDLKTGKDLSKGWLEIAIQLFLYVTSDVMWDYDQKAFIPIPAFDQTEAYVIGLPLNGTISLERIDLTGMDKTLDAVLESKRAKKRAPDRVTQVLSFSAPTLNELKAELTAQVAQMEVPKQEDLTLAPPQVTWDAEDGTRVDGQHVPIGVQVTPSMVQAEQDTARRMAYIVGEREPVLIVPTEDGVSVPQVAPPKLGPGQKACSVCRVPGHRKGSPKCLGAPSTQDVMDEAPTNLTDTPTLQAKPVTGVCHCPNPGNGGFTLNQEAGLWVHADCGQPAEQYALVMRDEVQLQPAAPSDAWAEEGQPVDALLAQINTALSVEQLNNIVNYERQRGTTWDQSVHLDPAKARLAWLKGREA